MIRVMFSIFVLIVLSNICFAQTGSQRREYVNDPRLTSSQNAAQRIVHENKNKAIGTAGEANANGRRRIYSRRPTISKEDRKLISPDKSLKEKYSKELKSKNTKLIKLLNAVCDHEKMIAFDGTQNKGCYANLPGQGAFYSFRKKRQTYAFYSDLRVYKGWFLSTGEMVQGLVTSFGKVEFNTITINDTRLNYLKEFTPATNPDDALRQKIKIEKGINDKGVDYNRVAEIKVDEVYALRSVAYNSKLHPKDKRRDIIVVFKVVKKEQNGDVVLIWKTLQEKKSPTIAFN